MAAIHFSDSVTTLAERLGVDLQETCNKAESHFDKMDDGQIRNALGNAHQALVTAHSRLSLTAESADAKVAVEDFIGMRILVAESNARIGALGQERITAKKFQSIEDTDIFPGAGKVPFSIEQSLRNSVQALGGKLGEYPFGDPKNSSTQDKFVQHAKNADPYDGQELNLGSVLSYVGGLSAQDMAEKIVHAETLKVTS